MYFTSTALLNPYPTQYKRPSSPLQFSQRLSQDNLRRLDRIKQYYHQIDRNDVHAILTLFAPNAVYEREGWAPLMGINEIANFFHVKRNLRGRHTLNSIGLTTESIPYPYANQSHQVAIMVKGAFTGRHNNQPIRLTFKDLWVFNTQTEQVMFRKSWLSTPSV